MKDNSRVKQLLENAWAKRREENYDEALFLVTEAHRACDAYDYNSLGSIYHVYMQLEYDIKNYSNALELCQKSLDYYTKSNNPDRIAHATRHIADLEYQLRNDSDSEHNYRKAIAIYRNNPDTSKIDLANALRGFALILERNEKIEEAITTWNEVKELYLACDLQAGVKEANTKLNSLK